MAAGVAPRTRSAHDPLLPLVRRSAAGDDHAFAALVEATYADTWTLALRLVGNPDDAADVVQEVYVRAYRSLEQFRAESRYSTWLYRVTANCARSFLGRRHRHRHEPLDTPELIVEAGSDPQITTEAAALRTLLGDAVAALAPRLRAVVVLHDVYGLGHEAIAEELGIGVSASKVRLHRARVKLRARLTDAGVETAAAAASARQVVDGAARPVNREQVRRAV